MSVKMIAEFRKKPSRARQMVAREERARARAEELSALGLFTRNQFVGIDFGVMDPEVVVIHDRPVPAESILDPVEARLLDMHLQRGASMMEFDRKFGF